MPYTSLMVVDFDNLRASLRKGDVRIDWVRLLSSLRRKISPTKAVLFTSYSDDGSMAWWQTVGSRAGYEVRTWNILRDSRGNRGYHDVVITEYILREKDRYDGFCIVSSDSDFRQVIETLKGEGKFTQIASYRKSRKRSLVVVPDRHFEISRFSRKYIKPPLPKSMRQAQAA